MDKVFALLLYKNLKNYLDDALNHHKTEAEHIEGVHDTLQCLEDAKLFCNMKKCEFHQKKIEFLRVDISHEGFKMDDKKIMDVMQWQWPTTMQGICKFISFVNFYCHWIPGFSSVVKPLHALFQKDHKWDWTENKQTAFEILKWHVSQAPILIHANPERAFHMETDASNYVYRAMLSQKQTDG
jgi:anti-sigma28 factor (negative regulator of flagellin synthesis)